MTQMWPLLLICWESEIPRLDSLCLMTALLQRLGFCSLADLRPQVIPLHGQCKPPLSTMKPSAFYFSPVPSFTVGNIMTKSYCLSLIVTWLCPFLSFYTDVSLLWPAREVFLLSALLSWSKAKINRNVQNLPNPRDKFMRRVHLMRPFSERPITVFLAIIVMQERLPFKLGQNFTDLPVGFILCTFTDINKQGQRSCLIIQFDRGLQVKRTVCGQLLP